MNEKNVRINNRVVASPKQKNESRTIRQIGEVMNGTTKQVVETAKESVSVGESGFRAKNVTQSHMGQQIPVPENGMEYGMLVPTDMGDIWLTCHRNKKGKLVASATARPESVMIAQIFICGLSQEDIEARTGKKPQQK